jgi:uncharacterized protein (DUF58 family)
MKRLRLTPRGVCLFIIGVLVTTVGTFLGSAAVIMASALVLAVIIDGIAQGLRNRWLRSVSLRWEIAPNPCFAGQIALLTLDLLGKRRQSVGLLALSEAIPADFAPKRTPAGYVIVPPRRGQFELGPVSAVRHSPLLLWKSTVQVPGSVGLIVWPQVAPVELAASRYDGADDPGNAGQLVERIEDQVLRDYRPGDELRRVNWRASAKAGVLMTKVGEPSQGRHCWLGLSVSPTASAASVDMGCSVAASLCLSAHHQGLTLEMAVDAGPVVVDKVDQLTALAMIEAGRDTVELDAARSSIPSILVCCAGRRIDPAAIPQAPAHRAVALAVLIADQPVNDTVLADAGWVTILAGPDTGLGELVEQVAVAWREGGGR